MKAFFVSLSFFTLGKSLLLCCLPFRFFKLQKLIKMTIYGKLLFIVTLCSVFQTLMATSKVSGQCMTEHNIPGMALKGHTFKKSVVRAPYMCDFKCEQDVRCQSFNYVIRENVCELNNGTREEKPEHFVRDPERFYIKRLSTVPRKGRCCTFYLGYKVLQKEKKAKRKRKRKTVRVLICI